MIKNIATALIALVFLAGCSTGYNIKKPTTTVETSLLTEFERNVGDRVFFAYDSSELSKDARHQLDKQIQWLMGHPSVRATIEGHCDDRGTTEYNLALGERRAEAVKKYLQHGGIDSHRLDTISYGKERPAAIGNTEDAWSQNRRGVTSIR